MPDLNEYNCILRKAWDKGWITNRGNLVIELEEILKSYLGVTNILITNNGTIPLQIAIKLLGGGGEIITTPFSYIATTAAIVWENCKPVFVDIHPEYLTIDERKIEEAITTKTTAILATHVFGNPCNVEIIGKLANQYNIKVIYDSAHCFSVRYKNESIFNFGDISTCSFHATKLFHTGEGGAVFCKDEELQHKIFYSHNFGHNGPLDFHGLGINGKISELQAALGLAVFPHIKSIIQEREKIVSFYNENLSFKFFKKIKIREDVDWNFSYYPLIFDTEEQLLQENKILNEKDIFPRRYFYPSLNTVNYINGKEMPISESISKRIMCLPLYCGLNEIDLERICCTINRCCL